MFHARCALAVIVADLEILRQRGAGYLAIYSGTRWWPDYYKELAQYLAGSATVEVNIPAYQIYRLENKPLGQ
jgi:hypothetical protein